MPEVTVLMPAYNAGPYLREAIESVLRQTFRDFEFLLIDDGSTDGTENLCRDIARTIPNLQYERALRNQGLAKSRYLGITMSKTPLLAFIDDDCIPRQDWVERMLAALDKHPSVDGAIESPTEDFWKLCHNIGQFHPFLGSRKARKTRFIAGANMAFQRRVLEAIGGFEPERSMAEDMECVLRAGRAGIDVAFRPEAVVMHDPPRTGLREILRYAAHHARTTVHLRRDYRTELGTPALALSPAVLLLASPIIAILTTCKIFLSDPVLLRRHMAAFPVVCALKLAWCVGACQGLLARKET